ncbi:hypothetical protein WMY93_018368 [Mugilogobius chulae]|uniref:Uncharacterized protein n=1 Tax=Mugilogobius chulae TaxID=88201 RepID=A0AAW0NVW7_9GOBI
MPGLWMLWTLALLAPLLSPFHFKFIFVKAEITSSSANRFYLHDVKQRDAGVLVSLWGDAKVLSASGPGFVKAGNNEEWMESGEQTAAESVEVNRRNSFTACGREVEAEEGTQRGGIAHGRCGQEYKRRVQESFVEAVQGGFNPRAEQRRSGEEARASSPRQSEPHLDTSTFALAGDSAHNQAMVHWSGHNSSKVAQCAVRARAGSHS